VVAVCSMHEAAANDRSPSDDLVRGTATVLDAADLRPVLTVAAADGVIMSMHQVGWCIAVQAAMYHQAQLVLNV